MLDYKLLEAFSAVISEGGFDKASYVLHITQSAVSQRVKQLEDHIGQILLRRTTPPEPTHAGKNVLRHYQQVKQLEDDLFGGMYEKPTAEYTTIPLAINADSLATWFLDVMQPLLQKEKILLDLRVDDQEQTHRLLKDGEVVGCISTKDKPFQGCGLNYLGTMDYFLICTPAFKERWFAEGFDVTAIQAAPAVIFNRKDELHHKLLYRFFNTLPDRLPTHYVPSPEKFLDFIAMGLGYGMLPIQQCEPCFQDGTLVTLLPEHSVPVPLYYHYWNLRSNTLERLRKQLCNMAGNVLRQ